MRKVRLIITHNSESMGSAPRTQWPPTRTAIPHGPFPISFPIQIPAVCRAPYLPDSPGVVLCVWLPGTTLHPLRQITKRKHHNTCSKDPVTQFSLLHKKNLLFIWKHSILHLATQGHAFVLGQIHVNISAFSTMFVRHVFQQCNCPNFEIMWSEEERRLKKH